MLMTPPLDRHYRAPRAAIWFLRGFLTAAAGVGVLCVVDNQSGVPDGLVAIVYYGFLAGILVWGERFLPRAGMYESGDGLRVVHSFGSTTFHWESIARFEHSLTPPRSRVLVVGHDGRRTPIIGTAQGSRVTWDEGDETTDIVAVLNERLRLRSEAPR